jgi:DNA modification methylase
MEINKIYQGHTPEVLKTFPDDSIDCVVTSPPYWSLRDYKLELQIWDGDAKCKHEWNNTIRKHPMDRRGATGNLGNSKSLDEAQGEINEGFCSLCGAWRGQLGLEPTFELYLKHLIQIFDEIKRVLKPTGTCWVNLGDSYSGSNCGSNDYREKDGLGLNPQKRYKGQKPGKTSIPAKSLCAIPERFKIMMIDRGWICRNTIIWYKRNCMPSSANDRFTVDFEYVYFFVKNQKYWFEQQFEEQSLNTHNKGSKLHPPIEDAGIGHKDWHKYTPETFLPQGRNKRCVWDITTQPYSEAHFATFPEKLVEPMIRAGCPKYICKKCGKAREKIFKETEGKKYTEEGNPEGINRSKMKWNDSHPTKNPRFWSDPTVIGYTDCGCNAGWEGGIILDPFIGSGTVAKVAKRLKRNWIGIELNPEYIEMAKKRIKHVQMELL